MDVIEIANSTGIAPRRLRYTIYHTLMPGVRRVEVGKGAVRRFTQFEAFGIALAATLLEAGLRREAVAGCMDLLVRRYPRETPLSKVPLWRAFTSRGSAHLDIGDRRFVRLRLSRAAGGKPLDLRWARPDGEVPEGYQPVVLLTVNVAPLRDALGVGSRA